ncbi:MAG: PAS domain S-box protein, partial [Acidobacteriales bacterium]
LDKCNAEEVIDVVKNHQFALIKREGEWVLIESNEQKEALAALRVSEENYRGLFTSMSDGFAYHQMIYDESGKPVDYVFLDVNDAFIDQTGLIRDAILGRRVTEVIPGIENDPNNLIELYGKTAKTGEPVRREIYFELLHRWYSIFAYSPRRDYFIAIFSDVSERKRTEAEAKRLSDAVKLEKDRLSALVNSIQDEVWFADLDKRFTLANPSALKEFGLASGDSDIDVEKLAQDLEVYRPDGSPRPVEEAPPLRAIRGEVIRRQEEVVRTPGSGELRNRDVSAAPVRDTDGRIIGSVSVVRDITDLKKAEREIHASNEELSAINEELAATEEELRASNEHVQNYANNLERIVNERTKELLEREGQYRILFDSIDEGFCTIEMIFDPNGNPVDYRFLEVNASFEQQTGLHDSKGKSMRSLVPDHEAFWFETYGKVAKTGEPVRFTNEAKALNRWYDVYAFPVGEEDVKKVGILFNDISEKRRLEERLRKFMDASTDSMVIYDGELYLRDINEAALKIFFPHLKREDVVGKSILELAPSIERTERYANYRKVLENGVGFTTVLQLIL